MPLRPPAQCCIFRAWVARKNYDARFCRQFCRPEITQRPWAQAIQPEMLYPSGWKEFNSAGNALSDISLLELIFVSNAFRIFSEFVQHIAVLADWVSENGCLSKPLKRFDPVAGKNDIVR